MASTAALPTHKRPTSTHALFFLVQQPTPMDAPGRCSLAEALPTSQTVGFIT